MYMENTVKARAAEPKARRFGEGSACLPSEARREVERAVAARRRAADTVAVSDALLVATELTTNAIIHGGGITDFRVDVDGPGIRVSVCDRSDRLPAAPKAVDDPQRRGDLGGRGWPIVCRLAREVRVRELPAGGKCITAVLPLP
ncbi:MULTISPECIES: ATP-binding protein [Streptomyces]|uniref:ATP-binding protein n=2 Tax=Streptomyces TaxID=1883 RepID=A0ABD5ERC5_9ACTN|nr:MULTISPECIES: ATP-binding protein [unclassified Streptomyces]MDT0437252.1 ATP-binding protein [Streptomyces sp. DSM 41981]SCE34220.1 Anti-sigma regulatory factor (Ser/Thr protein kinase) [Streptomyces sp. SolWspMP-5a-2]